MLSKPSLSLVDHAPDSPFSLSIPIITSGYSGSGKDTVSNQILTQSAVSQDRNFRKSICRFTDRHQRPGETEGVDDHFVSTEDMNRLNEKGEFFYHYQKKAYGGTQYGFSYPVLLDELRDHHMFLTGGEIGTAVELFHALEGRIQSERNRIGAALPLQPIILFVNRHPDKIIEGLKQRGGDGEEIEQRVKHIREKWEKYPVGLNAVNGSLHYIWNDDLESAAINGIEIIRNEIKRQLKNLFGADTIPPLLSNLSYAYSG